jgi:hypothetical protein
MSLSGWIQAYRADAKARNDGEALRMLSLYDAMFGCTESDPLRGLALLVQARDIAVRLGELWWPLEIDHWRLQLYLHYLRDVPPARDLAVRATLEVRKPEYEQFPQRVCLHEDLIYAHLFADPDGYGDLIGQALDYMQAQAGDGLICRHCIQNCRTEWHLYCARLEEAEGAARRALQMADERGDQHNVSAAQVNLCTIAHRRGEWDTLRGHAEAGEEAARGAGNAGEIALFLLWRALAACWAGDEATAQRLMRQAVSRAARLRAAPSAAFYDALCAFHRRCADLTAALAVRDRQLAALAGKGRFLDECRARVDRCRLLRQMGRSLADDLAAAREAAQRLRDPAAQLTELERIEAEGA